MLISEFATLEYLRHARTIPDGTRERKTAVDAGQLAAVVDLLQVMTGTLSHSLASAPVGEEEVTPETAAGTRSCPRLARSRRRHSPGRHLREFSLGE
jgi:hypothetical protein